MLGYDMSWASFHVVEVMSSSRIHLKAIGYLAASQSFDEKTDVLMLTTNTFKKVDLTSAVPAEISASVNALSHVISPDLARDLSIDLVAMLNHSRPYIRKRAVLAMYKVFVKYPEALPHSFARFREKLEDSDPGVVSATVNVLCEIARQNPENYLPLAPQLFHILTTSSNNWMLIKVIKLFGALAPFEPRLVKKLQAPITDLISTTPAVSLLYECVRTCIIGGMLQGSSGDVLAKTCVEKLATFLEDSDQNLKYIALLALVKIVPSHPHLVAVYQDVILASINDQDISIRMRSLELLTSMVTPYNLQSIVQQLLAHLVPSESATAGLPDAAQSLARATTASAQASTSTTSPSTVFGTAYRLEVSRRILDMCSRDTYENVQDFEWYLSVLVDLSYVANVDVGVEIKNQLMDVAVRVKAVRRYAVTLMTKLLSDDTLLLHANDEGNCTNVLWAAAWICGEYCRELVDPQKALDYLLQPNVSSLSPDIISVYLQSALKIFGYWAAEIADRWRDDFLDEVKRQVEVIVSSLGEFIRHSDIEVQERVRAVPINCCWICC
ncbi:hypothetical protein BOTBODRAFT_281134 [Botryobasidium botryosum FD-172 SS1]|uniref:Clathrin/coatomer adaptor adaptin-like N-terminal domain-containing protein n=1 Tax=Botryobasidium botryosum (strain FD-172 SS1) TaxID=930990 RepID=A0A067MIE6_BOTB1|nr:hypothetical protein BOTBODRAFT_281134 [Botryobasidium botryosum FD-172 SS1]